MMDIRNIGRACWHARAASDDMWTWSAMRHAVALACRSDWPAIFTPPQPVPSNWCDEIAGREAPGLAARSGSGFPLAHLSENGDSGPPRDGARHFLPFIATSATPSA